MPIGPRFLGLSRGCAAFRQQNVGVHLSQLANAKAGDQMAVGHFMLPFCRCVGRGLMVEVGENVLWTIS